MRSEDTAYAHAKAIRDALESGGVCTVSAMDATRRAALTRSASTPLRDLIDAGEAARREADRLRGILQACAVALRAGYPHAPADDFANLDVEPLALPRILESLIENNCRTRAEIVAIGRRAAHIGAFVAAGLAAVLGSASVPDAINAATIAIAAMQRDAAAAVAPSE